MPLGGLKPPGGPTDFPTSMRFRQPFLRALRRWGPSVLFALAISTPFTSAQAAIYKYVDRHGISHYSDSYASVPAAYRDQVRDVAGDVEGLPRFNVIEGLNGGPSDTPDSDDSSGGFGTGFPGADMLAGVLRGLGFGVVLLFLLAIPILLAIGGLILQLACRIGGADPPGLGRAIAILFAQSIAGGAVGAIANGFALALGLDQATAAPAAMAVGGVTFLLSFLANAAILSAMASCDFLRALWVCVVHTLLIVLLVLGPIAAIAGLVWLKS